MVGFVHNYFFFVSRDLESLEQSFSEPDAHQFKPKVKPAAKIEGIKAQMSLSTRPSAGDFGKEFKNVMYTIIAK